MEAHDYQRFAEQDRRWFPTSAIGWLAASALFVFGSLALPGCSADKPSKCSGTFTDVTQWCPRTFDGTLASLPACGPSPGRPNYDQSVKTCGDLIVLTFEGGFTAALCFFDLSSHELVGGELTSDISEFCDMTSSTQQAGKVPASSCDVIAPMLRKNCNEPRDAAIAE